MASIPSDDKLLVAPLKALISVMSRVLLVVLAPPNRGHIDIAT